MNPSPPDWRTIVLDGGTVREAIPDPGRIVVWIPARSRRGLSVLGACRQRGSRGNRGVAGTVHHRSHVDPGPPAHRRTLGTALEPPGRFAATSGFPPSQWSRRRAMRRQTGRPDPGLAGKGRRSARSSTNPSTVARYRPDPKAGAEPLPRGHGLIATPGRLESNRPSTDATEPNPLAHMPRRSSPRHGRPGALDKEATALTDLGAILLNEGDSKGAIASLEQALAIARQIGDTARESDVLGNLGMAMLTIRQPGRARELFTQELAHARATPIDSPRNSHSNAWESPPGACAISTALSDYSTRPWRWHASSAIGIKRPICSGIKESSTPSSASAIRRSPRRKRPSPSSKAWEDRRPPPTAPTCRNIAWAWLTNHPSTVDRSAQAYLGGSIVASVMAGQTSTESQPTPRGPAARACSAWPCRPPRPWPASPVRVSRPTPPEVQHDACRRAPPASITPACAARFVAVSPTSKAVCSMKTARSANGRRDWAWVPIGRRGRPRC